MENYVDYTTGETTRFITHHIPDVGYASEVFGKTIDGALPIVLMPGSCCPFPFLTVPEGCYAIVQSFGKDVRDPSTNQKVWQAGLHITPPWFKVKYLITKQSFVFDTPVKGCTTADNVNVTIDVSLTVRIMGDTELGEDPDIATEFLYSVGATGLSQQLTAAQEEAVRRLGRSVNYTEVYGLRSIETHTQVAENGAKNDDADQEEAGGKVTEAMKRQLNDQFNSKGVQITDVAITNVRLPLDLTKQMQEKTTYASVISEQRMKQQNDMQLLAMKEETETASQQKREEQMEEESVGVKAAAEKQMELDSVVADTQKMIRELQEEEQAQIRQIKAQADLEVKEIIMEKETIMKRIAAESEAKAQIIDAETGKFVREKGALSKYELENGKATAIATCAKAEGEAAPKLRTKRMFQLENKQVEVYENLADNDQVVVSGNTGDSLLAEMLVAQRQSQILVSVNTDSPGQRATVQANRG